MERHMFFPQAENPDFCRKCGFISTAHVHLKYEEITNRIQSREKKLEALLEKCEEYFDNIADADQPSGAISPVPNEEMVLLTEIRRVLGRE